MKRKVVSMMLGIMVAAMGAGVTVNAMPNDQYSDVKESADYFSYVEDVFDNNIMSDITDKEFGVEEAVNREDAIMYLYRVAGEPEVKVSSSSFNDVDTKYSNAISWAEENKLFEGMSDDFFTEKDFNGEDTLTRSEFIQIVYNFCSNVYKLDTTTKDSLLGYSDENKIEAEYRVAVNWAVVNNLLILNEKEVEPNKEVSRVQVAETLSKIMKMKKDSESKKGADVSSKESVKEDKKETASSANKKSTNATADANNATVHTHNWVTNYEMVHHDEVGHWENQMVKDAWSEEVSHDAEGHYEKELVKDAWSENVHHDAVYEDKYVVDKEAVYKTVHHDAVYEDKYVLDKEAVYETIHHDAVYEDKWIIDTDAWDEPTYDWGYRCNGCGWETTDYNAMGDHTKAHAMADEPGGWTSSIKIQTGTIHHEATGHTESVLVRDAWDEKVLVSPEIGHTETVVVKEAWNEQVLVSPEVGHTESVLVKDAWDETINHEAEYKDVWVEDKAAWVETINHEAEYADVWVVDTEAYNESVPSGSICSDCGELG